MTSRFLTRRIHDGVHWSTPRWLLTAMIAVGLALGSAGVANADPASPDVPGVPEPGNSATNAAPPGVYGPPDSWTQYLLEHPELINNQ